MYARQAPSRGHPVGHFRTRHGPWWKFHEVTGLEVIKTRTMDAVIASRQPKATWKPKV